MSVAQSPPPRGSLQVARVAGVPVYIGRGWLLLAAFVAWTGWSNNRDLGTGTAVVYAGILVVSILVAVLGHEVAHAVSARLVGLRVHRIVADLWGGHTAFDGSDVTAGRNAIVSVSGPLANVAMAGIGAVLLVALPSSISSYAWPFVVLNLLLGVFNMLPGLPLDGGHAAIACYERFREWRGGTRQRYFADVERLMPFAMGVIVVLAMLMFSGLYLDITQPIG